MISRTDAFLFVMDVDKEIAEKLGEEPLSAQPLVSAKSSVKKAPKKNRTVKKFYTELPKGGYYFKTLRGKYDKHDHSSEADEAEKVRHPHRNR